MLRSLTYNTPTLHINLQALHSRYTHVCALDSNRQANDPAYIYTDKLIAIGMREELVVKTADNAFEQLQHFCNTHKSWIFGYLSYDLKNEMEALSSENHDGLGFAALRFFVPQFVIEVKENTAHVHYEDRYTNQKEAEQAAALAFSAKQASSAKNTKTNIRSKISRNEYIECVNQLKKHILLGDIYEVNFCQEFYDANALIDPPAIFEKLNSISEAPFAAFCKFNGQYILSSSPERFLRKENNTLISQPIKGTIRRSANAAEDEQLKHALRQDPKEQNENVMIVDLVRNDLSRIAERGTVRVDELFGIYSFRQVHQMISTVSCKVNENKPLSDILRATFPMGSMTGAPKVRAMQLIERYESAKRGVYSGALGYISPSGNFDFNVVIRSILYNAENRYLSFMTGSAITAKAEAENEYEECLLKARAMMEVVD